MERDMSDNPQEDRSRFTILFGLDRYGTETYIEEASKGESYYCPQCGEPLEVRKGDVLQYFAHWRMNPAAEDCELRSSMWIPDIQQERRQSPAEKAIREKKLVLAVRRHAYTGQLELLGVLPAATWEEWLSWSAEGSTVETVGLLDRISRESFHPEAGRVIVRLDPKAGAFAVTFRGSPAAFTGSWRASFASPYLSFVGTDEFAEETADFTRLRQDSILFIEESTMKSPPWTESLSLGSIRFRRVVIDEASVEQLRRVFGKVNLDLGGFTVRVVLPGRHAPSDLNRILVEPGSRVRLHVVASARLSFEPEIEVIPLPFQPNTSKPLLPRGVGVPRPLEFIVNHHETKRYSFFWGGRHVFVQAIARERPVAHEVVMTRVSFEYSKPEQVRVEPSFDDPLVEITQVPSQDKVVDEWHLLTPRGFPITVESSGLAEDGRTYHRHRAGILSDDALKVLASLLRERATQVRLDFGMLGSMRFSLTRPMATLSDEEIRMRVLALGIPRECGRWSYILKVAKLPPNTPHEALAGLKKRVRRIILEARKAGMSP